MSAVTVRDASLTGDSSLTSTCSFSELAKSRLDARSDAASGPMAPLVARAASAAAGQRASAQTSRGQRPMMSRRLTAQTRDSRLACYSAGRVMWQSEWAHGARFSARGVTFEGADVDFFRGSLHCCEYFTPDVRKTSTGVATSSDPGSTDVASRRPDPVAPTAAPHGRLPSFGRCTLGSLASRTVCLHRSARRQRRGRWRCEHPRMLHAAATPMCAPNMHRQNICMQVRLCSALMADGAVILGGCWFSA